MDQIINLDTWEGELPDALTETGRGGVLSGGYPCERPAIAAIGDDETVKFVVTNRKRGVTIAADDLPISTAGRLRELDEESVTDVVTEALAETDWTVRAAPARSPFDRMAERGSELMGVVVQPGDDGPVRDRLRYCETITGAGGTDTVMLATTALVGDRAERLAADLGVRLLSVESVAAIVDSGDITVPAEPDTTPADEDLTPRD